MRIHHATVHDEDWIIWAAILLDDSLEPLILHGRMAIGDAILVKQRVLEVVGRYSKNTALCVEWVEEDCVPVQAHMRMTALLNSGIRQGTPTSRRRSPGCKKRKGLGRAYLLTLIQNQGDSCYWCKKTVVLGVERGHPDRATIDHLVPVSLGGGDETSNLRVACNWCNHQRGNRTGAMPAEGW